MTRREKLSAALYVATIVAALVFVVFAFCRCGGSGGKEPDVPKLIDCASEVVRIVTSTPDCHDIGRELDKLLAAQAQCFEALTGEKAVVWSCADGGSR